MAIGIRVSAPSAAFVYHKKNTRKTMRAAGTEVLQTARSLLRAAAGAGAVYRGSGGSAQYRGGYKKGAYRASAPGQTPVKVTGALMRSLRVRPFKSGTGVAVRSSQFYALFLEAGANGGKAGRKSREKGRKAASGRVLEPRPFLTAAMAARVGSIGPRLEQALQQDIVFVRQPVAKGRKP